MVKRLRLCAILICFLSLADAQTRLSQTIEQYTTSQKRLLARNFARFLFVSNQGQWDLDSASLFTCHYYGFNRQFPHDEMIADGSIREELQWLHHQQVPRVLTALNNAPADKKIRLLLELAIYYIHQPGTSQLHLDSATIFISEARQIASRTQPHQWLPECDALLGECLSQQGRAAESLTKFAAVANSFRPRDKSQRKALAYHQWGIHMAYNDTNRIHLLEKAFGYYQDLGLKEQGIEVMSDIVTAYFSFNWQKAVQKLNEVLLLEKSAGYQHTMDTYYVLSYLKAMNGDHMEAILYGDSALAVMAQTGDSLLYSLTCMRIASVYVDQEEHDQAIVYHKMGLARRYQEPQRFWYKNFLFLAPALANKGEPKEALTLLETIGKEFPPIGLVDSLQFNLDLGLSYEYLGKPIEAEKYYRQVLEQIERIPLQHRYAEITNQYYNCGRFYFTQQQYSKARSLIEKAKGLSSGKTYIYTEAYLYYYLYKLDSIDGNFEAALANHRKYKLFYDSLVNISQRFKRQELNVRYETTKKDQDIKILTQDGQLKESALQKARLTRNIVLAGLGLLVIIAVLLYNQYRIKKENAWVIGQKNAALEQLLDEKKWLLKEVHHRVKNSLQTIVSLLELQTDYLQDDPLAAIQASQNRIFATSLLHQKLYQADNGSSVNMSVYLPELVHYLEETFHTRNQIHFQTAIDPIDLDISQAVPIGIIFNEAITNAIKHAFPGDTGHDEIHISLTMIDSETAELQIVDNGKGIPFNPSQPKADGLGLNLVRGLTEDIDGTVQILTGHGTTIIVRFKPRPMLTPSATAQTATTQPI